MSVNSIFFFLSCDCIITLEPNFFFFFLHQRIGYPLQYSWASLVAQLVTNPSVMPETWVRSLGWEDRLEKGKATHSIILAWRTPWTIVHGVAKSQTGLSDFLFFFFFFFFLHHNPCA